MIPYAKLTGLFEFMEWKASRPSDQKRDAEIKDRVVLVIFFGGITKVNE